MAVAWGIEGGEPCFDGTPGVLRARRDEIAVVQSVSSGNGWVGRIAAGSAMAGSGPASGRLGWVARWIVGLVPRGAEATGVYLFAPLFHLPFCSTGAPEA